MFRFFLSLCVCVCVCVCVSGGGGEFTLISSYSRIQVKGNLDNWLPRLLWPWKVTLAFQGHAPQWSGMEGTAQRILVGS